MVCLLATGFSGDFTCEAMELVGLMLLWTRSFALTPSRPERGFLPSNVDDDDVAGDEDETSFSLIPSLSLVLGAGRSLDGILSDASVPLPPSCTKEDELIRELSSLRPSLPERRLVVMVVEEGVLVLVAGFVILKDEVAEVEGELMSDIIVLSIDVSKATRVEGLETPPGRRIFVVVEGFWSSREKTDDIDA